MKPILAVSLLLVNLISFTHALGLVKRASPAVLEVSIQRPSRSQFSIDSLLQHDRKRHQRLSRRQAGDTVGVQLDNELTSYIMVVDVGTPAQTVGLHIDTGSSDLWVNTPSSPLCTKYSRACNQLGTFTASSSSTYALQNNRFDVRYQDGTGAKGNYVTDTISIGNVSIPKFEFGIATQSTSASGIAGIGYRANEGISRFGLDATYANLPARLAMGGIINSNAYSLWLNDLSASQGSILFGGVNTAKYNGALSTLPVIPTNGVYSQLILALTAVGMGNTPGSFLANAAIPALLDSGTTLTYLPTRVARAIFTRFGASYDARSGIATVDCGLASAAATVTFSFSGVPISVPLSELVIATSGSGQCAFGIAPSTGITVLGDTFLRSAYVVYDLANNQISLAQTRFGSAVADNIREITAGANGVPGATAVSGAVSRVGSSGTVTTSQPTDGFGDGGGRSGAASLGAANAALWAVASVCAGAVFGLWIL